MGDQAPKSNFQRDLGRMLLTFFAVVAIDLLVISLFTGKIRFWFPLWLDPRWEDGPRSYVTYSQSYFAGICLIPMFLRTIDREFMTSYGTGTRAAYWLGGIGTFGFVLWWKCGLMLEHGKSREALAWLILTLSVWQVVVSAETLPLRLAAVSRRVFLGRLLAGIAAFFLVMSVLDPLVQIGLHGLPWSAALAIEVAFFVPAGIVTLVLAKRLNGAPSERRVEGAHFQLQS